MAGLLLIVVVAFWAMMYRPSVDGARDLPVKISEKLDQLWEIAQESIRENKYLRAEKALLTILRVDERNATAYNRLGILYAKQRAYKDAIECFEIAQSLEPNASSLHNVGLIYFETGDFEKAALAFEQALALEGDLAARHIAYAKVQEKLGHSKKMIESLEEAVRLEPNPHILIILAEAYESTGQADLAAPLRQKAARMMVPDQTSEKQVRHPRQPRQPRKIVM